MRQKGMTTSELKFSSSTDTDSSRKTTSLTHWRKLSFSRYDWLLLSVKMSLSWNCGSMLTRQKKCFDGVNNTKHSQAVASPAYIVASLENLNEVSADFFCPVKKCFEYACEANFRKSMIPEYMREYEEIEIRWDVLFVYFMLYKIITITIRLNW